MVLGAVTPAAAAADEVVRGEPFPRPAALEPQVRFWRSIFTEYSANQVVVHDALRLDKIYRVLDLRDELESGMSQSEVDNLRRVDTDLALDELRTRFLRLHSLAPSPDALAGEDRRLFELLADDPAPDRFLAAAGEKRLRSQRGLRERFAEAIRVSRRYLPEMERIFREEGVPVELTRLPLIESCFNLHAYSKAGAAGIWQFMPATGRRFLRVDNLVDERRDPITATRAAAQFLGHLHDALGAWPLAITAYNHGPEGIARAVEETGSTDIATIVRDYRGAAFGFASRNFYAEFLAALDIDGDYQKYFGELPLERPLRGREHRLERSVGIETAARLAHTDREELATLNPALSAMVVGGRRPIPAGYRLRLPESGATAFASRLADVPAEPRVVRAAARSVVHKGKTAPVRTAFVTHRVRRGQTLSHIAKQHRVSVARLMSANRLRKASTLKPGQTIKIPVAANAA